MFGGMKIVVSPLIPEVPKIQLSDNFNACSPEIKRGMNEWLKCRFGTHFPAYVIAGNTCLVHPEHVALLRLVGKDQDHE